MCKCQCNKKVIDTRTNCFQLFPIKRLEMPSIFTRQRGKKEKITNSYCLCKKYTK